MNNVLTLRDLIALLPEYEGDVAMLDHLDKQASELCECSADDAVWRLALDKYLPYRIFRDRP